eukprot:scaffold1182_cov396-Prasinococcus_capsulatus_cf.AAC.8
MPRASSCPFSLQFLGLLAEPTFCLRPSGALPIWVRLLRCELTTGPIWAKLGLRPMGRFCERRLRKGCAAPRRPRRTDSSLPPFESWRAWPLLCGFSCLGIIQEATSWRGLLAGSAMRRLPSSIPMIWQRLALICSASCLASALDP